MTDVYISCARDDAERMAPLVEAVQAEGWSAWFEPDAPPARREHAIDAELGAAGAVIVLWTASSRESEFVRTEAATGLYRNKLIQITLDGDIPPRPFDQLEAIDIGSWNGDSQDPTWQRILGCIRLFAGSPGADRPQVVRNSAAGFASSAAARPAARPTPPAATGHDVLRETPGAPQPTHVFDAPVEPASADAARTDQSLGVAAPEAPVGTVTPATSADSPIDAAVSEMERTLAGAVREPTKHTETQAPARVAREPEPEPTPWSREPEQAEAAAPADPIRFVRSRGGEAPPEDDEREWPAVDAGYARSGGGRGSRIQYSERRPNGIAPVAIVGTLAVLGGGLWFVDPLGWREGGEKSAFAASPVAGESMQSAPVSGVSVLAARGALVDDPIAHEIWKSVDRSDPDDLRGFIVAYRETTSAETARALLKVLDAQAWADAVTADVEPGYQLYLASFPAPTGEMAGAATNRLTTLGEERRQAISTIQIQLHELGIYDGANTGAADLESQRAADRFAAGRGVEAPALAAAAPRDLRAFGDRVLAAVRAEAEAGGAAAQVAALSATTELPPLPQWPEASLPAAAAVAEPVSVAELVAVVVPDAASPVEADTEADADVSADALASDALRLAAWEQATQTGTVDAYVSFLRAYPNSENSVAASAAIEQLSRPEAYGLDWLNAETQAAVEAARAAQAQANAQAAAARAVAERADGIAVSARSGLADARTVVAPDGDIYETQVSNSQPNGLGVRTAGDAQSSGDRYRGQLSNGLGQGLGVYEYGENPNNQAAQALRYEGEHSGDVARGYGVTQWKNGNRFEGLDNGEEERGAMAFANGQRYEGEMRNGNRHGYGVFWTGDGEVMLAGRWENGDLVEPMTPRVGPDIPALMASAAVADTP